MNNSITYACGRRTRRLNGAAVSHRAYLATIAVALLLGGCRDPRRAPHPAAAAAPSGVDDNDPAAVARAYLESCQTLERVGVQGMRDAESRDAFKAAEAAIMRMSDREGIRERCEPGWGRVRDDRIREERIDSVVKNWPSILANYMPGVDFATLTVAAAGRADAGRGVSPLAEQVASVSAVNPKQRAVLERVRAELATQKDARGQPLPNNSAEFERELRWKAVQSGVSPHPAVSILIGLRSTEAGWRVTSVGAAPIQAPPAHAAAAP